MGHLGGNGRVEPTPAGSHLPPEIILVIMIGRNLPRDDYINSMFFFFLEHEPQQDRPHEDGSHRKDENGAIDSSWRLHIFYSHKPTEGEQDYSQGNANPL